MKRDALPEIWCVWGDRGDYEERRQWVVECITTNAWADARVEQLNALVRGMREELGKIDDRYPNRSDNDDAGNEQWDRWERARKRLDAKYRRLAGDPDLESDASYSCVAVPLRSWALA